jgi:hypothetical protein
MLTASLCVLAPPPTVFCETSSSTRPATRSAPAMGVCGKMTENSSPP